MRPIPEKLKDEMASDPFYSRCCLLWIGGCSYGKIEWHHNEIYAGRQTNEKEAILPLCVAHHKLADRKDIRELLNIIMQARYNA